MLNFLYEYNRHYHGFFVSLCPSTPLSFLLLSQYKPLQHCLQVVHILTGRRELGLFCNNFM